MATELKTKIQLRNDTKANWEQYNPTLLAGELGVATDTGLFKIGDGATPWNELPYANDHSVLGNYASHYEGTAQAIEGTEPTEYETDNEVIARVMGETLPVQDDIFIVKCPIGGEAISYTAYVYNGNAWTAMDGNYNADNVYFDSDLIFCFFSFTIIANHINYSCSHFMSCYCSITTNANNSFVVA